MAYSISALVAALGSKKLMPPNPDCSCKVINGRSGYARENTSWVIGRVVRDINHWTGAATRERLEQNIADRWARNQTKDRDAKQPARAGLVVSVYEPSKTVQAGELQRPDWLYWSGVVTMAVQLGLAAVPLGVYGDWSVMLLTVVGTLLALFTGSLSQWKREKWACRRGSKSPYILTEGNGAQHAILILGNGHGLNLDDLSTGQTGNEMTPTTKKGTRYYYEKNQTWLSLLALATLWIVLLITATGVEDHTWYLLGVGGLGIVQNMVVVGVARTPWAQGLPLDFVGVHGDENVMKTLFIVEKAYPGIGRALRDEFFPGGLTNEEVARWEEVEQRERSLDK